MHFLIRFILYKVENDFRYSGHPRSEPFELVIRKIQPVFTLVRHKTYINSN